MPFHYESLDPATRRYSVAELHEDLERERLVVPERLHPIHAAEYSRWLEKALKYYDDLWLEERLEDALVEFETRRTKSGGRTTARVPEHAARILAEGVFNHYYMRGLCARALAEGHNEVEVYRARLSLEPRSESAEMEGESVSAEELLAELRHLPHGISAATLGKHGSGMSVRLPAIGH